MFWRKKKKPIKVEPNWHRLSYVVKNALERHGWHIEWDQTAEDKKRAFEQLAWLAERAVTSPNGRFALSSWVQMMFIWNWDIYDLCCGPTKPGPGEQKLDEENWGAVYKYIMDWRQATINPKNDDCNFCTYEKRSRKISETEVSIQSAINEVRKATNVAPFIDFEGAFGFFD